MMALGARGRGGRGSRRGRGRSQGPTCLPNLVVLPADWPTAGTIRYRIVQMQLHHSHYAPQPCGATQRNAAEYALPNQSLIRLSGYMA